MTDYNPDPRQPDSRPADPARNYEYVDPGSNRAGYVLLGVLAAVALVGGYLYFSSPQIRSDQQAQMPDRTMSAPAPDRPALPGTAPQREAPTAIPPAPAQPGPQPQE